MQAFTCVLQHQAFLLQPLLLLCLLQLLQLLLQLLVLLLLLLLLLLPRTACYLHVRTLRLLEHSSAAAAATICGRRWPHAARQRLVRQYVVAEAA